MNRQAILRLVQSIPSPRVEPLRQWLAEVGEERLEEIEDPEAAIERVRAKYRAKGYDDAWIEERIKNDLIRNELTDEWQQRGATTQRQFGILTMEMDTRVDHVISKYKILVEQGMGLSDVILHLNREGLSIIESIKTVRILYKLPLGEAKQIVSNHQVWETTLRNNEPFHEELENAVNSM